MFVLLIALLVTLWPGLPDETVAAKGGGGGGSGGGGGASGGGGSSGGGKGGGEGSHGNDGSSSGKGADGSGGGNGGGGERDDLTARSKEGKQDQAGDAKDGGKKDDAGKPLSDEGKEKASTRVRDVTPTLAVRREAESNHLAWAPPVDEPVVGFQIWRSLSPFALIATVPGDQLQFQDVGAPAHAKYKVTAFVNETVEGGFIDESVVLESLPEFDAVAYQTAAMSTAMPSPFGRFFQGLGLGTGLLLIVTGATVGRHQVIHGVNPLRRSLTGWFDRSAPLRVSEPEMHRLLGLWESAGRPFALDEPTMRAWMRLREDELERDRGELD